MPFAKVEFANCKSMHNSLGSQGDLQIRPLSIESICGSFHTLVNAYQSLPNRVTNQPRNVVDI